MPTEGEQINDQGGTPITPPAQAPQSDSVREPQAQVKPKHSDPEYAAELERENIRRRRENRELETKLAGLEDKLKGLDTIQTLLETMEQRVKAQEEAAKTAAIDAARAAAAKQYNWSEVFAKRLQGATPEEIAADALELAKEMGLVKGDKAQQGQSGKGAHNPNTVPVQPGQLGTEKMEGGRAQQIFDRMRGRNNSGNKMVESYDADSNPE